MSTNLAQYSNITKLEDFIRDNLETVELEVTHHHIPGVYVRAIYIPKDNLLTGKIHKYECVNIMAKGILVISDENGLRKTLVAGDIFNSPAGTKRAGYALEDVVYITVHHSFETDISALEKFLVCDSVEDYGKYLENMTCHSQD
jgi:hypothetical protein